MHIKYVSPVAVSLPVPRESPFFCLLQSLGLHSVFASLVFGLAGAPDNGLRSRFEAGGGGWEWVVSRISILLWFVGLIVSLSIGSLSSIQLVVFCVPLLAMFCSDVVTPLVLGLDERPKSRIADTESKESPPRIPGIPGNNKALQDYGSHSEEVEEEIQDERNNNGYKRRRREKIKDIPTCALAHARAHTH
ncbi:hypothetical protein F2Q69_00037601 [Brassica cretica]|uniref:Uncharacterized protein n=1 Tax=Brassica cretica TaxID=69181 RepID=A0A8S9SWI6_BRACR|nr:hypothetical protein F2Q69_00037601 [Brassica cretica]